MYKHLQLSNLWARKARRLTKIQCISLRISIAYANREERFNFFSTKEAGNRRRRRNSFTWARDGGGIGQEFIGMRINANEAEVVTAVLAYVSRKIRVSRQGPTLISQIAIAVAALHRLDRCSFFLGRENEPK